MCARGPVPRGVSRDKHRSVLRRALYVESRGRRAATDRGRPNWVSRGVSRRRGRSVPRTKLSVLLDVVAVQTAPSDGGVLAAVRVVPWH